MSNDYVEELDVIHTTLTNGGLILYPTDTIWGIGGNALNVKTVEKIYKVKKRPRELPFILLVDSIEMLKKYVFIHPRLETLLSFHEKPLSIVYSEVRDLPAEVLSENGSIAMRVTLDPFCKEIITLLGNPIVSTSANVNGDEFPKHFHEVSSQIIRNMDYIVQYRQNDFSENLPSVLAEFNRKGELSFLRE